MTGTLRVKKWNEFQHYKGRNPPWIKLHKQYLDDYDFHRLPVDSRALAPMIWLLASESKDGSIDYNLDEIGFRLRMSALQVEAALVPLISGGFLELARNDSGALAERKQDALTEAEAERETEAEKEAEQSAPFSVSRETFLQTCWTLTECDKSTRPFNEMVFGQWWSEGVRAVDLSVVPPILERQRVGDAKAIMPPGYYTNAVRDAMRKRLAGAATVDDLRAKINAAWSKTDAA